MVPGNPATPIIAGIGSVGKGSALSLPAQGEFPVVPDGDVAVTGGEGEILGRAVEKGDGVFIL